MNPRKIIVCVGTRPNFIKIIKLRKLFEQAGFEYKLLHTGQHFDANMSSIFFEQLNLGEPDYYLGVSGSDINDSTGKIICSVNEVFKTEQPDMVVVVGDVNSTFACAFAAASLLIPVAHIESGLRSGRMSMPEERNRILTDNLSSLLFVTEEIGVDNLKRDGFDPAKVKLVGNTMVDALIEMMPIFKQSSIQHTLGLAPKDYVVATFHRPINVDSPENLATLFAILTKISAQKKVIVPLHPRTLNNLNKFGLLDTLKANDKLVLIEPLGYIDFVSLVGDSFAVISDSGGIQTEASFLDIPCITLRDETELMSTVEKGTNTLCHLDQVEVASIFATVVDGHYKHKVAYHAWDGLASDRIVAEIKAFFDAG